MWLTVTLTDGTKITYWSEHTKLSDAAQFYGDRVYCVGEAIAFRVDQVVKVLHADELELPEEVLANHELVHIAELVDECDCDPPDCDCAERAWEDESQTEEMSRVRNEIERIRAELDPADNERRD